MVHARRKHAKVPFRHGRLDPDGAAWVGTVIHVQSPVGRAVALPDPAVTVERQRADVATSYRNLSVTDGFGSATFLAQERVSDDDERLGYVMAAVTDETAQAPQPTPSPSNPASAAQPNGAHVNGAAKRPRAPKIPTAPPPAGRIRVRNGKDIHRVLDDLDAALAHPATGDRRLYQRSGELVIARGVMAEDAKRLDVLFAPDSIILAPLRNASLIPRVTEHVDFGHWAKESRKAEDGSITEVDVWKGTIPSGTILSAFLAKVFWGRIRPIRGISVTPVIHLDGSIVADGYDAETQYLVASNIDLPPIPERPTQSDAEAALAELREPFAEFQFETADEGWSPVALALTLLLRPVIRGNVAAFVQTAPQKNCGKSLTVKGAVMLAKGQVPAANTWPKDEEEQEKMIGSAADAGADVLFFDNVQEGAVIGGAPLDKVLTCDGQNSFRVLGQSQLKRLPWGAVVVFTANRGRIGGDSDRRIAVSTLIRPDRPVENFAHPDLLEYIRQGRPRLLAAAFTLIRAWVQAERPGAGVRRLDSFEHWSATVAAMIRWAGGGDVRELVKDVAGTDTDDREATLLEQAYLWQTGRLLEAFTAKELATASLGSLAEPVPDALTEAVEAVAGYVTGKGERRLDMVRFGKRLARMKNVVQSTEAGKYKLKMAGKGAGGSLKWTVACIATLEPKSGVSGVSGVSPALLAREENRIYITGTQSTPLSPLTPLSTPAQVGLGFTREPDDDDIDQWP